MECEHKRNQRDMHYRAIIRDSLTDYFKEHDIMKFVADGKAGNELSITDGTTEIALVIETRILAEHSKEGK